MTEVQAKLYAEALESLRSAARSSGLQPGALHAACAMSPYPYQTLTLMQCHVLAGALRRLRSAARSPGLQSVRCTQHVPCHRPKNPRVMSCTC